MEREEWARNTLERAATLGHDVYYRARRHPVNWSAPVKQQRVKSSVSYTSLEEAFSSIENYLSTTTQSCQKYYRGCQCPSKQDVSHCGRFHNQRYAQKIKKYCPTEDVHMMLPPGSYSISAKSHIDGNPQSHIIHIREGQTVNVDFVL